MPHEDGMNADSGSKRSKAKLDYEDVLEAFCNIESEMRASDQVRVAEEVPPLAANVSGK